MRRCTAALTIGVSGLGFAFAQDEVQGYYISASLGGGYSSYSPQPSSLYTADFSTPVETGREIQRMFPKGADTAFDDEGFNLGDLDNFANWAAGFKFSDNFRIEAEVSYLQNDVDVSRAFNFDRDEKDDELSLFDDDPQKGSGLDLGSMYASGYGKVETKATFANGLWDFPIEYSAWKPYVGAGIGVAQVDVDYTPAGVDLVKDKETVFAYQAMMGVSYTVRQQTDFMLGARYRGMSDVDMQSEFLPEQFAVENSGLIGEVGLRLGF